MGDLNYVMDDTRDDSSLSDGDLEGSLEDKRECQPGDNEPEYDSDALSEYDFAPSSNDDSDALSDAIVCAKWDEPNYISADHVYYSDISRWQASPDSSLDK